MRQPVPIVASMMSLEADRPLDPGTWVVSIHHQFRPFRSLREAWANHAWSDWVLALPLGYGIYEVLSARRPAIAPTQ